MSRMGATRVLAVSLAATAVAVGACGGPTDSGPPPRTLPGVFQNEPGPGDPPVVWIGGTLEAVEQGHLAIREGGAGDGPRIRLERLAEGATSFYRRDGEAWREIPRDELDLLEVGERACVEALLDGRTLLALRVFLDSRCGPSAAAG